MACVRCNRNRAGGYHSRPHRRRERSRATFLWETERVNSTTPLDKVAAIVLIEKFCILIKISLKFVPYGPIDITAWRRIGDKPLSEPMLTRFTDTSMRH